MDRDQPYIHFTSTKHLFTPIAIGTSHPPTQVSILGPNPPASRGNELVLLHPKERQCLRHFLGSTTATPGKHHSKRLVLGRPGNGCWDGSGESTSHHLQFNILAFAVARMLMRCAGLFPYSLAWDLSENLPSGSRRSGSKS